jgi:ferredoxin
MKIVVKKDLCCGAASCVKASPAVYKLDEFGYNKMDGAEVPAGQEEAARRGAAICPESAIELVE